MRVKFRNLVGVADVGTDRAEPRVAQRRPRPSCHAAALPCDLRQFLADRFLEAGAIVADGELDTGAAALLEPREKLAPARSALPVGGLDRQNRSGS